MEVYAKIAESHETSQERIKRLVTMHEKVIVEHKKNIEVLKKLVHEERLKIMELSKDCKHEMESTPDVCEHGLVCKNCGVVP